MTKSMANVLAMSLAVGVHALSIHHHAYKDVVDASENQATFDGYQEVFVGDNHRCSDGYIGQGYSGSDPADCKQKCEGDSNCNYFSVWESNAGFHNYRWCRRTSSCNEHGTDGNYVITTYQKASEVQQAPTPAPTAPAPMASFDGYQEVFVGDNQRCSDGYIGQGYSGSDPADCKQKCEGDSNCNYFSVWESNAGFHNYRWCRRTSSCNEHGTDGKNVITTYQKASEVQQASLDAPADTKNDARKDDRKQKAEKRKASLEQQRADRKAGKASRSERKATASRKAATRKAKKDERASGD